MKVKFFPLLGFLIMPVFVLVAQTSGPMPSPPNYIPIIAAICGAVLGAILTQTIGYFINRKKDSKPKIIIEKNSSSLFTPFTIADKQKPQLHISSQEGNNYQFNNLFLTTIRIQNRSGTDFQEFDFGLSAPEGYNFINIEGKSEGHLHKTTFTPQVDFKEKSSNIIVKLTPFNRNETYSIITYLTSNEDNAKIPNVNCDTVVSSDLIETINSKESEDGFFSIKFWAIIIGMIIILVCIALDALNIVSFTTETKSEKEMRQTIEMMHQYIYYQQKRDSITFEEYKKKYETDTIK